MGLRTSRLVCLPHRGGRLSRVCYSPAEGLELALFQCLFPEEEVGGYSASAYCSY